MEKFVAWVIAKRKLIMVLSGIVTVLLLSQLRQLQVIIDVDDILPQSHPYIVVNNIVEKVFGNKFTVVIGVTAEKGDIFQAPVLSKVKNITERLGEIDGVVKNNVVSLAARKAKDIEGTADGMAVKPLMEKVPTNDSEMQSLKKALGRNPVYENLIVSKDFTTAQIVAEFRKQPGGMRPTIAAIKKAIEPERDGNVDIVVSGLPIFLALLEQFSDRMGFFFPLAVLIIGLIHYEAFRSWQALFLPLVTALTAVAWATGGLALMGQPLDVFNSATPILILAIAAGHAVQILKRYYEEYSILKESKSQLDPAAMNREAVLRSLTKVGPVMIVACVIAALGFFSLVIFEIKTIRVFGIFTAIGILSALVLEMTFIPALRCMLSPPSEKEYLREKQKTIWDSLIGTFYKWTRLHRKKLYTVTVVAIGILSVGSYWLTINNSQKDYFYGKIQERIDDDKLNERMAGANTIYVLVDGNQADQIKDPKTLKAMEETQKFIDSLPIVGKTVSIVDFLKRMNQALNNDQADHYKLPESLDLVAQYLLLYSSSGEPGDFDSYVDNDYKRAVIQAYLKTDSSALIQPAITQIENFASQRFGPGIKVGIGGGTTNGVALNDVMIQEKVLNILQIMGAVFLVTSLVFRSLMAGLLVLVPLAAAVAVNFGLMGLLSIPLQIATAMVSAMAVGIGADYGIYMSYRMREELQKDEDEDRAIKKAFHSAGKATLFVSSAVAGGFGVLMLSWGFLIHIYMGFLISMAMIVSSITALTLFPSLLFTLRPKFIFKRENKNDSYKKVASLVIFGLIVLAAKSAFSAGALSAEDIMNKNSAATKVLDSSSDSTFTLINSSGEKRVRQTRGFTKLIKGSTDNMRLVIFNSPADVKGTKTLLIEHLGKDDDMWIYLPAMKKTRRLVSSNKKESFVGTDFSYGDVIGHKVSDWKHKLVKEEKVDGKDCYVVESLPAQSSVADGTGYSKRMSWIDKESFVLLKGEGFDTSGKLLRNFVAKDIQKVDAKNNKWQPMHLEAENTQTNHKTVIEFTNFKANVNVPDDTFTVRFLEKQ